MGNRNGGSRKKNKESVYKYAEPNVADETPKKATNNNAPQRQFSHSGPSNNYRPGSAVGHSNGYTPQSGASTVGSASHQAYPSASVQNHSNKNNLPSTTAPSATKPAKSNTSKSLFVANYDFNGTLSRGELSFIKGDKIEVTDRSTYHDWWHAKNLRTKQTGYVPANYISPLNDLTVYEWYFTETNRRDAERFLEQPHHGKGTFLIRPSDTNQGQESLSLLDLSRDKHFHVKHYRIRRNDQGMYFISNKHNFPTLPSLVDHYRTHVDGLCCLLTRPCRKVEPTLPGDRHGLLELDRNQLERTVLLGKGNYGEVYRGKYGQRDVAIKCMKTDGKNRLGNVEKFIGEAKMMKDLLHKNIVRLYGVCTEQEPIFIVTEYMANGCLLNYLRDSPGKNLKFKTLLDYAAQIAKGMVYLEQKRYVHCDLAARNILLGEADVVKIGDFGLAKTLQGGRLVVDREAQFPIKWTAPEAATNKEYTTKSDVWSFGVLLYELITYGSNPYPGMSNNEALQSVLGGYRMPKPSDCHDSYYQIMIRCWQADPADRPTFEAIYAYFDDFMIQAEPSYRET